MKKWIIGAVAVVMGYGSVGASDLSGTWTGSGRGSEGKIDFVLTLKDDGSLTGTVKEPGEKPERLWGDYSVSGTQVTIFLDERNEYGTEWDFSGTLDSADEPALLTGRITGGPYDEEDFSLVLKKSGVVMKRTWEVYEMAVKSTEVDQDGAYARLSNESERNLLVVNTEKDFAVLIGLERMEPWAMEAAVEILRFPAAAPRQGAMGITTAERNIFSLRLETDGFGEALLLGTETISRKVAKDGSVSEKFSVSLRGVGIDYDPQDDFGPEYEYSVNSARHNLTVSDRMNRSGDPLQPLYEYVAGKTGLKNDLDEVIDSIGWAFEQ